MLPQRHDSEEGDDAGGNDAGFESAKAHVTQSDGFILPLDDGEQRDRSADRGDVGDEVAHTCGYCKFPCRVHNFRGCGSWGSLPIGVHLFVSFYCCAYFGLFDWIRSTK
jgi:hypothetical protein